MSKVLVDRKALEEAAEWLEVHSSSSGSAEAFAAETLSEAIAQAAEAEGVDIIGYMDGDYRRDQPSIYIPHVRIVKSCAEGEALMTVTQHLAALSAVTAERDRLDGENERLVRDAKNDAIAYRAVIERQEELRAEVEMLRKDADRWNYVRLQGDDTHWLNLLRVDLEDFGGNINAAVDALIDSEAPATEATQ